MATRLKRPRDPSQLAKLIVDISVGDIPKPSDPNEPRRGRAGGLKGGIIRAKKLPPARRISIAKRAAQARWRKKPATV